jgi:multidrug efflux pump subunit AcrA (membrane-fusion protein)
MPTIKSNSNPEIRHTDDIQDIITTVPSWMLRWGITLFFCALLMLLSFSAFIKYPDIIKTQLKITSPNAPKQIVTKITGKLVKLLVDNNDEVKQGQALAYIESTANHAKVLLMLNNLKQLQNRLKSNQSIASADFNNDVNNELGELQAAYQAFSEVYLMYKSSVENGFLLKKRIYLKKDITALVLQTNQLQSEKALQQRDFKLAEDEFSMHQKLAEQKVETPSELRQQESKYLSRKAPIMQTDAALINAGVDLLARQKDIMELDNQVQEQKIKFSQALNSLISQTEDWKAKYVLSASEAGIINYAGIIQENQVINLGQDVFYVNGGNEQFFGEMTIPQENLGKVKKGQEVLVKLKSYPFEEYGILRGQISFVSDVPYRDSIFKSKVTFLSKTSSDLRKPVYLKQGMVADAEIVTQDASILQRLTRSVIKAINSK